MSNITRRVFLTKSAILSAGIVTGCSGGGSGEAPQQTFKIPVGEPTPVEPIAPDVIDGTVKVLSSSAKQIEGAWTFKSAKAAPSFTGTSLSTVEGAASLDPAVVPGTPLTSMIKNGDYPDALYRHIVTDVIPDELHKDNYWYRTEFETPELAEGQRLWLRFDGINYLADVWLNGKEVGRIEGAFIRGIFDVTEHVAKEGGKAVLAVLIYQLDRSEAPLLPSYSSGLTRGKRNGGGSGITNMNGATFFCTAGWDWLPTIPDRNMGIWQPVSFYTSGEAAIGDVRIESLLSEDLTVAEIEIEVPVNYTGIEPAVSTLSFMLGDQTFDYVVEILPGYSVVKITSKDLPQLRLFNPELWWPNGYGEPHLHELDVTILIGKVASDSKTFKFGIRKIEYHRDNPNARSAGHRRQLQITVNNLPILIMGGNWGLDEALKRIPRQRIFDQIRMHRDANYNLIRNWNGQSTTQDLFDACDKYGILVWQDFFYSTEHGTRKMIDNKERTAANMRDCIVRYRNHPSLLLWCGGNEGAPAPAMVEVLDNLVQELDPRRLNLTSSARDLASMATVEPLDNPLLEPINGFTSGGPYHYLTPANRFARYTGSDDQSFKNELGSYSIPTLEFIQSMIPEQYWETPNDYWADRDINGNGGNGGGAGYIALVGRRYGEVMNLADFARKAQMMNYEEHKAIYEAHAAIMLKTSGAGVNSPATGVVLWMSNPAQPSFVWQIYSHDLEQHSTFFGIRRACRRHNAIINPNSKNLVIANHTAEAFSGMVTVRVLNLDGTEQNKKTYNFSNVMPASYEVLDNITDQAAEAKDDVCFISLLVEDINGEKVGDNFYWLRKGPEAENYTVLDTMPKTSVSVSAAIASEDEETIKIAVDVRNPGKGVSLMTHLQLFDKNTGKRVLPAFYSDNYLNLVGGEKTALTIEVPKRAGVSASNLAIRIDGWNLDGAGSTLGTSGVPVHLNTVALNTKPAQRTFALS